MKWRQEVLTRIYRLLALLLGKTESDPRNCSTVNFLHGKPYPVYIKRNFNVTLNIQRPGHLVVNEKASPNQCFQEFSSHLFPLLIETWVEAMASEQLNKNQGDSDTNLSCHKFNYSCFYVMQDTRLLGTRV